MFSVSPPSSTLTSSMVKIGAGSRGFASLMCSVNWPKLSISVSVAHVAGRFAIRPDSPYTLTTRVRSGEPSSDMYSRATASSGASGMNDTLRQAMSACAPPIPGGGHDVPGGGGHDESLPPAAIALSRNDHFQQTLHAAGSHQPDK